jgi:hypothetical protein
MRLGTLFLLGMTALIATSTAVACQQKTLVLPDEEDPEPLAAAGADASTTKAAATNAGTNDTCLGKAHLAFDDVACNKCMSDNAACCAATIACFGGDVECAALHTCISRCGAGGSEPPGADGGDGGDNRGDAGPAATGTACKDACKAQHPTVVAKWQPFNTCAAVTCKADCL